MIKTYISSFVTFVTRNEVRGALQKRRFQGFMSETLRVIGLLGEKIMFFKSHRTTKISRTLKVPEYINVLLLINFTEQFELWLYFKYSRSYKVL